MMIICLLHVFVAESKTLASEPQLQQNKRLKFDLVNLT
jgi:hypothetical protein